MIQLSFVVQYYNAFCSEHATDRCSVMSSLDGLDYLVARIIPKKAEK
jgi:hypothetical protein